MAERTFPAVAESVRAARQFAAEVLPPLPQSLLDTVLIMVSELASNSVEHADTEFTLSIEHSGGRIRVQATDSGSGEAVLRHPGPTEARGRGLLVIDQLSDDWGVIQAADGTGKTIWCSLNTELSMES
ncbi:MAG: ATP-binding protein [Acidimicrobiales bacterium]|jgi:anti-sigma regulatory factor (Ser/Thr protein kinase)